MEADFIVQKFLLVTRIIARKLEKKYFKISFFFHASEYLNHVSLW